MNPDHAQTPSELVFPPQVPFSWTRRWRERTAAEVRSPAVPTASLHA